jgi:molybdate transport system ATP-binding protein
VIDLSAIVRRGSLTLDADLAADEGQAVAVMGPNGSGKTTLLRLLAGLEAVDSGYVQLNGRLVDDPAQQVFVRTEERFVGYVPQGRLLFPNLTVFENAAFGCRARGLDTDPADGWLQALGLGGLGNARPSALSGGQAQRVALARALAAQPQLLLLDEPSTALDSESRDQIIEVIRMLDITTVVVTHDLHEARQMADRTFEINGGRLRET